MVMHISKVRNECSVSDEEVPQSISPYSLIIVKFYFLSHLFVLVWFLVSFNLHEKFFGMCSLKKFKIKNYEQM